MRRAAGASLKERCRTGRWVLKGAMEPYLPKEVIYLEDVSSERGLRRRGLFEPHDVRALVAANDRGEADEVYTLLSLLNIETWCRAFVDAAPVDEAKVADAAQ